MFEPDRSRPRNSEQASHLRVIAAEPSVSPQRTGLADAGNEAVFCSAWLSSQCTRISGVIAGLLMMPPPAKGLSVASTSWPQRNPYLEDLLRLAERASLERRTVVSPGRMVSDTSLRNRSAFSSHCRLESEASPSPLLLLLWHRAAPPRWLPKVLPNSCDGVRDGSKPCPGPGAPRSFQPRSLEPHRLSISLPQSGSSPDYKGWRSPSLTISLHDFAATVCRWASSGETAAFACARFPTPPASRVKAAWLMR